MHYAPTECVSSTTYNARKICFALSRSVLAKREVEYWSRLVENLRYDDSVSKKSVKFQPKLECVVLFMSPTVDVSTCSTHDSQKGCCSFSDKRFPYEGSEYR